MPRLIYTAMTLFVLAACGGESTGPGEGPRPQPAPAPPNPYAGMTAFAGATIWDGSGGRAIEDSVLIVRDGRIVEILSGPAPDGAEIVDLGGSWVIPGIINAHGHVSGRWAPDDVADTNERVRGDLALYARYGVTTVLSLGGEPREAMAVRASRDDAALQHARLYVAGPVVADDDAAAARAATTANVALGVDWIKIRVDDSLGTAQKMPWDAVQSVFDAAHAANVPVATHLYYLDDARRLLELGSGLIAHSVRDQQVDDPFVEQLLETGICYVPTLTREVSTFVYGNRPDFFDDPFFSEAAKQSEVDRVSDAGFMQRMAASPSAAAYRAALIQAQDNLRILIGSGVPVAFGTDSGPAGRFPGYFEHIELFLMIEAGLTPREALLSATSVAADCLGLQDVGTLTEGKWADFVVLSDNPLADIGNTRTIRAVYVAGNSVPR